MHTQNNYTRKVVVPSSVNIKLEQGTLSVEGPLGTLQIDISLYDPSNLMNIQIKENPVSQIVVQSYYQYAKPIMQTFSTIIESSMIGVTQGHMMQLEAVGEGTKFHVLLPMYNLKLV
jgi:ribosomal protein L6P/L9E